MIRKGSYSFFVLFLLFNWLVDCGSTGYHSKSHIYVYIYIPYCSSKTALRFPLFIQSNRNNNKKNQMLPRSKWRQIAGFSRWLSLYVMTSLFFFSSFFPPLLCSDLYTGGIFHYSVCRTITIRYWHKHRPLFHSVTFGLYQSVRWLRVEDIGCCVFQCLGNGFCGVSVAFGNHRKCVTRIIRCSFIMLEMESYLKGIYKGRNTVKQWSE